MKNKWSLLTTLILALVLLGGWTFSTRAAVESAPASAAPSVATYTFYPTTVLSSASSITYSLSPRYIAGVDVSRISRWTQAEVFVTMEVTSTGVATVTAQVSADAVNWIDAYQTYVADNLSVTTSVVTGTAGTTGTTTVANSSALAEAVQRSVFTAAGADYFVLPLSGEYLRFKIEHTGPATPTIKVALRNP